jgi:hypothetical protein
MRIVAALVCGIVALFSFAFGARRKRSFIFAPATTALLLLVAAMFTLAACGGGGGGTTPPPTNKTYTLTITGSAGNLSHTTSVQLVVD